MVAFVRVDECVRIGDRFRGLTAVQEAQVYALLPSPFVPSFLSLYSTVHFECVFFLLGIDIKLFVPSQFANW